MSTEHLRTRQESGAPRSPAKAVLAPVGFAYLGVMVLTWAGNWPLMKLAVGEVPPMVFVLLRLAGSLILIAPALLATRQPLLPARGERLTLFWVGQLQVAGFLICSIIGLAILPAGRAIVLAYTMPLWAIPIGLFLWPEPLNRAQLIGAAIGFTGLVLFMNPGLVDWGNGRVLVGNALLLLAAIAWALGSCLYRQYSWRSPFWVQTFWQLAVSIVPVAAIVLIEASDGPVRWSLELVAILAYNCIVTTALGYFLWSKVLSMMPAAMAGQVLTLTPIGGFVLSTLIFGGMVTADVAVSIALIVTGILVTLQRRY
ncbi:MAG: DMT family transporter [Alphaproteobacteria bacterium]|nr:DMT family transporter [Alphaproteobacteria bacterium]